MVIKVTCTQLIKKPKNELEFSRFCFAARNMIQTETSWKKKANYVHTCKYLGEFVAGVFNSHGLIQGVSIPLFFQYHRSFE